MNFAEIEPAGWPAVGPPLARAQLDKALVDKARHYPPRDLWANARCWPRSR